MRPSSTTMSLTLPSGESAAAVSEITPAPISRTFGMSRRSSSVVPELDRARRMSFFMMRPRSPWTASAGWTKCDGVPVDASVAEIFWPTRPALPMPLTTMWPSHARIRSAAALNESPTRSTSERMASDSVRSTSRAYSRSMGSPILLFDSDPEAVADRHDDPVDAFFRGHDLVELPHGGDFAVRRTRVEELAERESIIDHYQPALPHDPEALLEVPGVVPLVGVEEGRVGGIVLESGEDVEPRAAVDLDPARN